MQTVFHDIPFELEIPVCRDELVQLFRRHLSEELFAFQFAFTLVVCVPRFISEDYFAVVLFSISVVALEFGAVLFYSTLSATDQKSISIERAFQAMREDGAVSGTAVLTDIDPGCRAELNGFKPYLDTRIEVFNGHNGQKNVLAEAGKALSSGSLSAICDDYGMDYAVLNYGINDVGIQDLKESGFKPVYSDNLTVCLKRSTV